MNSNLAKWAFLLVLCIAVCLPANSFAQKKKRKKAEKTAEVKEVKDTIITGSLVGGLS